MPYSKDVFKQIDHQIVLLQIAHREHELLEGPYSGHTELCEICYPRRVYIAF